MTESNVTKTAKGNGTAKEEMSLEKRIKNLQVSISIARSEQKNLLELLRTAKGEEKLRKIERLARVKKIIDTKTAELEPLKAQRERNPKNRSKVSVSQEEINAVMKEYNISL